MPNFYTDPKHLTTFSLGSSRPLGPKVLSLTDWLNQDIILDFDTACPDGLPFATDEPVKVSFKYDDVYLKALWGQGFGKPCSEITACP